jgi:hypothetical protein
MTPGLSAALAAFALIGVVIIAVVLIIKEENRRGK